MWLQQINYIIILNELIFFLIIKVWGAPWSSNHIDLAVKLPIQMDATSQTKHENLRRAFFLNSQKHATSSTTGGQSSKWPVDVNSNRPTVRPLVTCGGKGNRENPRRNVQVHRNRINIFYDYCLQLQIYSSAVRFEQTDDDGSRGAKMQQSEVASGATGKL